MPDHKRDSQSSSPTLAAKHPDAKHEDGGVNASAASPPNSDLTVVGIGASAGGLAALKRFISRIQGSSGLAYVIVVHLDPHFDSHLSDLLGSQSRIPVETVTEATLLEPDHVYVIPPNCNLSSIDTHLRLSELEEERSERAPIDHFFGTLAESHTGRAIGVILTGTGSDGALGLRKIKELGGLAIVQDPEEAEYDGMPLSALDLGQADLVLEVDDMPGQILEMTRTTPVLGGLPEPAAAKDGHEEDLQIIFRLLREGTGRDFKRYKSSTILRRLTRRMQLHKMDRLEEYVELLRSNAGEVLALSDECLINITEFFRDPEAFEELRTKVIPRLFEGKGPSDLIRVWSAGCSSGEEPYSIGMLLLEEADRHSAPPSIQIFASDLHEKSIRKAQEGVYPLMVDGNVSAERRRRFFKAEAGGYRIRTELRELIVFTPHNLLADPPFSKLDLVVCRNLLIYLQRAVHHNVIALLHYALKPDGYLMLGTSESIEQSEYFRVEAKEHALYRKLNVPTSQAHLRPVPLPPASELLRPRDRAGNSRHEPASYGELHQDMVELYAAPSVLVDANDSIVHLSQNAGRFLQPSGGGLDGSVHKLIREELRVGVRIALDTARAKQEPTRSQPVLVPLSNRSRFVAVDVRPAMDPERAGFALLVFDEREVPAMESGADSLTGETPQAGGPARDLELEHANQRLHKAIEEHFISQEEMKASNEELQSMNEELHSTLEELETSKEELQSVNEELQTVNEENRQKVEELGQLTTVLQNLMSATDIATLFLDRQLRIERFTPRANELFNVRHFDRGRPLAHLTHRLGYDGLIEDAKQVLERLVPIEREIRSEDGNWYLARVLPYRSEEDRIEGVVITFVDTTPIKRVEDELRESEQRHRLLVAGVKEYAILMMSPDGRIVTWNEGARRLFGYSEEEAVGDSARIIFTDGDSDDTTFERILASARETGEAVNETWHRRKDGTRFWGSGIVTALHGPDGELHGFAKVLRDHSERREAEHALIERTHELTRANEELEAFNYSVSHDLRSPLRGIDGFAQVLLEDYGDALDENGKEHVRRVRAGAQRMGELIDDLLDLSRVSRSKLRVGDVDMTALAAHIARELKEREPQRSAEVTIEPGMSARGDHRLLRIALTNLLENAWKFTAERDLTRIEVGTEYVDGDLTYYVQDNGAGFDMRYGHKLFVPFQRLHSRDAFPGSGIGLPLVQRIVSLHGGRAFGEGEVMAGAKFSFTLKPELTGH